MNQDGTPPQAGKRILVVDDDDGWRYATQRFLTHEGYEVHGAGDAPSTLAHLNQSAFDLLICDIHMPESVSGFGLARLAKRLHPDMPVIFVTAYDPPHPEPGETVLRKPIPSHVLLSTVRKVIQPGA